MGGIREMLDTNPLLRKMRGEDEILDNDDDYLDRIGYEEPYVETDPVKVVYEGEWTESLRRSLERAQETGTRRSAIINNNGTPLPRLTLPRRPSNTRQREADNPTPGTAGLTMVDPDSVVERVVVRVDNEGNGTSDELPEIGTTVSYRQEYRVGNTNFLDKKDAYRHAAERYSTNGIDRLSGMSDEVALRTAKDAFHRVFYAMMYTISQTRPRHMNNDSSDLSVIVKNVLDQYVALKYIDNYEIMWRHDTFSQTVKLRKDNYGIEFPIEDLY